MRRKFIALVAVAVGGSALYAVQPSPGYVDSLVNYLKGKSFTVDGKYFTYDFNKNNVIDYNDWIYIAKNNEIYRLLGKTPTEQDPFGWQPLSNLPADLDTNKPAGYFIFINMPLDKELTGTNAFSWVYVPNETDDGYKLMGATPNHRFDYLDIDGDNTPDPIPNLVFNVNGDTVTITQPTQSQNTGSAKTYLFYGETNHATLAGWKNVRVFDPENPDTILYKNDDTTDCRRPEVTTRFESFDPSTMSYGGMHMQTLHFVSKGYPYSLSLLKSDGKPVAKKVGDIELYVPKGARYTSFDYLGTKQYLIASDKDKNSYLYTPEGEVVPFTGKSLLDISYKSYGEPVDGYIVTDKDQKELQLCTTDMQQCTTITAYTKSVKNIGSIGGTAKSVYLIDNETYLFDKSGAKLEKLNVTLPPRVGHTTPYALNGHSLYYVKGEELYRYDIDGDKLQKISQGTKTARLRAFTDKMVIMGDDDYLYAAAKDGSTPQAILLSQTTETRGHKYNTSLGTSKYYIFNTFRVKPGSDKMYFRACAMSDQNDIQCKEDSFWGSTIIGSPDGKLDFEASYIYTPQKFIRIDNTDSYGGGDVMAVDANNPLGEGVKLGSVEYYNFQTFINSGYKDEMVNDGGYAILNAKNDITYQCNTFLGNVDKGGLLKNISNEPVPSDSEINGGRSHCHGRYCVICHSFAGGKIYYSWDPETKKYKDLTPEMAGKYTIQFKFDNGQTLRAAIKKGMGENFNTPLQNLAGKKFTAQVIKREDGTVVNSSDEYSHEGVEYFDCNYCHYRYGPKNGAPGVITVEPIPEQ